MRAWPQINNAVLWNVEAPSGKRVGQAVRIMHWEFEDGRHGGPDAPVTAADVSAAGAHWSRLHAYFSRQT